ncbi:hypothetical protein RND71_038631 [Anisodus tanguticus]|uniref:Uncharacterized protein n=1 Tax=Anisodus tanguticus TaxID=243964 RepID=A0AAE1R006_9SOLA|nr:hypothetical protein RND71_038631 [Anisodus tanguticus]
MEDLDKRRMLRRWLDFRPAMLLNGLMDKSFVSMTATSGSSSNIEETDLVHLAIAKPNITITKDRRVDWSKTFCAYAWCPQKCHLMANTPWVFSPKYVGVTYGLKPVIGFLTTGQFLPPRDNTGPRRNGSDGSMMPPGCDRGCLCKSKPNRKKSSTYWTSIDQLLSSDIT